MKSLRWIVTVPSVLLILVSVSWADTLKLRSGDQLIGTILSENQEAFTVDVNGIQVTVRRADVEYIIQNGVRRDIGGAPSVPAPAVSSATPAAATPTIQPATPVPIPIKPESPTMNPTLNAPLKPILPIILPQGKMYQVTGSAIRFRQGPNLNFPVVSTLSYRTPLIEIEVAEGWLHAKTLEGVEGWIHPNFVQPMGNLPCLVNGDGVNLRESPGEVYRSLTRLHRGDVVMKLEEQADWWFVLSEGAVAGWCNKQYFQPLTDTSLYKPPMTVVNNQDAGLPILLQKNPGNPGEVGVVFTIRDEKIIVAGITKIIIFHKDAGLFNNEKLTYSSPDIIQRRRMKTPVEMLNIGLPEVTATSFIGGDVLTLLGHKIADGWQYSLTTPDAPSITFGFVVQDGPARGTLVMVQ